MRESIQSKYPFYKLKHIIPTLVNASTTLQPPSTVFNTGLSIESHYSDPYLTVTSSNEGQASSPRKGQASLLSERVHLFPCTKSQITSITQSDDMPSSILLHTQISMHPFFHHDSHLIFILQQTHLLPRSFPFLLSINIRNNKEKSVAKIEDTLRTSSQCIRKIYSRNDKTKITFLK
jgi:hypothetical protein